MNRRLGLLVVPLLLVGQLLLGVGFSATYPDPSHPQYYPGASDLTDDYDAFVGDRVALGGTVVSMDPVTVRAGTLRLTLSRGRGTVGLETGDRVELLGVVKPGHSISPVSIVRYPPDRLLRTYVVSFVAGLLVLFRLLRHWQPDGRRLVLRPRRHVDDYGGPGHAGGDR